MSSLLSYNDSLYAQNQLVYLHKPSSSSLTAPSRKFRATWCGPFAIYKCLDRTHYLLQTLDGRLLQDVFNFNRLKPAFIRASSEKENISNLQKLKEVLNKADQNALGVPNKVTPTFTDESGRELNCFDNQVMILGNTESVDISGHLANANANNGFAAPCQLNSVQQERLLAALENAPTASEVEVTRARFKAGTLQLLVSMPMTKGKYQYWWSPDLYPDSLPIVENVLGNQLLMCTGSPNKFVNRLLV